MKAASIYTDPAFTVAIRLPGGSEPLLNGRECLEPVDVDLRGKGRIDHGAIIFLGERSSLHPDVKAGESLPLEMTLNQHVGAPSTFHFTARVDEIADGDPRYPDDVSVKLTITSAVTEQPVAA